MAGDLEAQLRDEVAAVHDFIAAWFRGDVARTKEGFRGWVGCTARWRLDQYPAVGPRVDLVRDLLNGIEAGHGGNPAFEISISDFKLHDGGR